MRKIGAFFYSGLGNPPTKAHIEDQEEESLMPLPLFLALIAFVIAASGTTLALAFWADVPLMALAFAALAGSLALGARQWR